MKRALTNLLLFTLGASVLSVFCQTVQPKCIVLSESDAGKTLTVKRGETICFKFPVLPANGYMWYPSYDSSALAQIGKTRFQSADFPGKPGLEQVQTFQFRANTSGVLSLRFKYSRPERVLKTLTFNLNIP
jgi:predicted secreted protein